MNLADLVITAAARPYLEVQKGSLDLLRGDEALWTAAYQQRLADLYASVRSHLPTRCSKILDVGAGMGGINVLFCRHYDGLPIVSLIDGEAEPPQLGLHRRPFSSREVAWDFLRANGVVPGPIDDYTRFDLVVSFGAWCFHFPPSEYLDFVLRHSRQDTVFILEVRREQRTWHAELERGLRRVAVIAESKKWQRIVYERR